MGLCLKSFPNDFYDSWSFCHSETVGRFFCHHDFSFGLNICLCLILTFWLFFCLGSFYRIVGLTQVSGPQVYFRRFVGFFLCRSSYHGILRCWEPLSARVFPLSIYCRASGSGIPWCCRAQSFASTQCYSSCWRFLRFLFHNFLAFQARNKWFFWILVFWGWQFVVMRL